MAVNQGMFSGMFDRNFLQEEEDARDKEAYDLARLDTGADRLASYYNLGLSGRVGEGLGRAAAGVFGAESRSPGQVNQDKVNAVRAAVAQSGAQPGTDEWYSAMVQAFQQQGMLDAAATTQAAWDAAKHRRAQTLAETEQAGAYSRANQPRTLTGKDALIARRDEFVNERLRMPEVTGEADPYDMAAPATDASNVARRKTLDEAIAGIDESIAKYYTPQQPRQETADWEVKVDKNGRRFKVNKRTGASEWLDAAPTAGQGPPSPFANLSPEARKAAEREQGKAAASWIGGGRDTALRGVEALEDVVRQLEANPNLVNDPWSSMAPDWARSTTTAGQAAVKVRDDVYRAIQSTLRETLGTQFTEREAQQLFQRSYDPKLTAAQNIKRLQEAVLELRGKIEAKDTLSRGERPEPREVGGGFTAAQEQWIARAQAVNPSMSREAIILEGKKKGKL